MIRHSFEYVEPAVDFRSLPFRLELGTSPTASLAKLMLLVPMMVLAAVPLSVIGARATEVGLAARIAENPVAAAQAMLGLLLWSMLFLWPLKRIIEGWGAKRSVEITAHEVRVHDRSPFGKRSWTTPLGSYAGIAHHLRASLSGTRHELILVHPDPSRNVLIAAADRITQDTFDRAKSLLQLPEIPARQLYARR